MMKIYTPRRLGLLAIAIMTLAGCAAGPNQSMSANIPKPGCCAGMAAGEACGCCKGMGMCAMTDNGSAMSSAKNGGSNDAEKPGCCAGMAGGGCGCCKDMGGATK